MFGLHRGCALGFVLTVNACGGDAPSPSADGESSTAGTGGGSSSESAPSDDGASTSSGGFGESSSGHADSSSSDDGTTGIPNPDPVCGPSQCGLVCIDRKYPEEEPGDLCSCEVTVMPPEGFPTCELPELCGGPDSHAFLCVVQALRYGVVGTVGWHVQQKDVGGRTILLQILGPGRAQAIETSFDERACCDFASVDDYRSVYPFDLAAADHPFWLQCIQAAQAYDPDEPDYGLEIPMCIEPDFLAKSCGDAPLDRCPAVIEPAPDATCKELCPMANDGVCDDARGTGLCPAGCDPLDCA